MSLINARGIILTDAGVLFYAEDGAGAAGMEEARRNDLIAADFAEDGMRDHSPRRLGTVPETSIFST